VATLGGLTEGSPTFRYSRFADWERTGERIPARPKETERRKKKSWAKGGTGGDAARHEKRKKNGGAQFENEAFSNGAG